jgi:hypothetical protein
VFSPMAPTMARRGVLSSGSRISRPPRTHNTYMVPGVRPPSRPWHLLSHGRAYSFSFSSSPWHSTGAIDTVWPHRAGAIQNAGYELPRTHQRVEKPSLDAQSISCDVCERDGTCMGWEPAGAGRPPVPVASDPCGRR